MLIIRPKEDSFRLSKLSKLARCGLFLRKAYWSTSKIRRCKLLSSNVKCILFQRKPQYQGSSRMGDCYRVCAIVCALFFPPIAVLMVLISKPITISISHMSISLISSVQPLRCIWCELQLLPSAHPILGLSCPWFKILAFSADNLYLLRYFW